MAGSRKKLLFDLDGTLTDPREGILRCYAHALQELGLPVPPDKELEKWIGPPVHEVFRDLLGTTDRERILEGVSRYRVRYSEVGLFENVPYEGIHEALTDLKRQGYGLWLCTSKPWTFAERILARFELASFFNKVYGPELDGTRGNKAELLAHLLASEKLDPRECVMIGDRLHDARAARANGTACVGVLYGFGDEAELRAEGVTVLCASPAGLARAVAEVR